MGNLQKGRKEILSLRPFLLYRLVRGISIY